jgi:hypothetical protein
MADAEITEAALKEMKTRIGQDMGKPDYFFPDAS